MIVAALHGRARGIVARRCHSADTKRAYGALGVVYQSLAKSDALIEHQCDGTTRRGRAAGSTDSLSVQRNSQAPAFIGQYGNAPDPCPHIVRVATESAAPRGRAALDGKTVRRQRPATVRQPSAAPILSNRNGSHAAGGTSPAWYVRRFCALHRLPATCNVGATCATWLRCTVYNPRLRGSLRQHEPAFPTRNLLGLVEGSALVAVAPPAVGSAAAGAVRFRAGPSGGLNLPSGPECATRPRESAVRGRHGLRAVRTALSLPCLSRPLPARSGGVSRETKPPPGDQYGLSPHGRPVRRDVGVRGWFAPFGWGGHSAALSVAVGRLSYGPRLVRERA